MSNDVRGYKSSLLEHYKAFWGAGREVQFSRRELGQELPAEFSVIEFQPHDGRSAWTYATSGLSELIPGAIELHLLSPSRSDEPVELLFAIAHFHRFGKKLAVGHTVNFGKSWQDDSECDHGLLSLPYLDGTELEEFTFQSLLVRCLWLIPVTKAEVDFKRMNGLEALEQRFEDAGFNYLDPARLSVC